MSAALRLLSECTAAGVELYLDNGRLRYRARAGVYTEALRQKVAAHKTALIALLQVPTPATPAATPPLGGAALACTRTPSGPIPWHDATPDDRAEIKAALFEGQPVQILSQVLGEIVWWVKNDAVAQRLRGGEFVKQRYPPYRGEVVYVLSELLAVLGFPPDALKNLHEFKKAFDARISTPRVVCSACRNLAATYHHCLVRRELVIANPDRAIECGDYVPAGRRAW
jgi:hypothetical protein